MAKISSLFVTSPESASGKTAVCLGLALKFKEAGLEVGYIKPLGFASKRDEGVAVDEDTLLMKGALNLKEPPSTLTPVIFGEQLLEDYRRGTARLLRAVDTAYKRVGAGKDLVVVEGSYRPDLGAYADMADLQVAKRLGSRLLAVSPFKRDSVLDTIIELQRNAVREKVPFLGVIINNAKKPQAERAERLLVPMLEKRGVKVWGVIPEDLRLTAPTVVEVQEALGGRVLAGGDNMGLPVETYMVGAMTPEMALSYFRKALNKAVITGGDRSDVALAALETSTSALILTGNLQPDVRLIATAEERRVPTILVPYDTFTTIRKIESVAGKIRPTNQPKIDLAKKLVEEHVDWEGLLKRSHEKIKMRLA